MPSEEPKVRRRYLMTAGVAFIAEGIIAYYMYMPVVAVVLLVMLGAGGLIAAYFAPREKDTRQ